MGGIQLRFLRMNRGQILLMRFLCEVKSWSRNAACKPSLRREHQLVATCRWDKGPSISEDKSLKSLLFAGFMELGED
jgi:hypothetical protein